MKKLIILALVFTYSVISLACSCQEMKGSAKEFLQDSDVVFLGIPMEDSVVVKAPEEEYEMPEMSTKFKVVKNFKNASTSEVSVFSEKGNGANCGVHFKKSQAMFLIFTYEYQGKQHTGSCSVMGMDFSQYSTEVLLELLD